MQSVTLHQVTGLFFPLSVLIIILFAFAFDPLVNDDFFPLLLLLTLYRGILDEVKIEHQTLLINQ